MANVSRIKVVAGAVVDRLPTVPSVSGAFALFVATKAPYLGSSWGLDTRSASVLLGAGALMQAVVAYARLKNMPKFARVVCLAALPAATGAFITMTKVETAHLARVTRECKAASKSAFVRQQGHTLECAIPGWRAHRPDKVLFDVR